MYDKGVRELPFEFTLAEARSARATSMILLMACMITRLNPDFHSP